MAGKAENIRKEIEKTDFTDDKLAKIYDWLDGKSDKEVEEYLWVNRDKINSELPAAVEEISSLKEHTLGKEPDWIEKTLDYEKIFNNPNFYDDVYNYSYKDFDKIAKDNGLNTKEMIHDIYNKKLERDRYNIAHGKDEGGWFDSPKAFVKNLGGATMSLLAPRSQEAIARGESPSRKDVALDETQNLLYVAPWGKVGAAAKALPKVGNVTKTLLTKGSDVIAPLTTETLDAIAYDEIDNAERGDFSPVDVAIGTLANRWGGKRIEPRLVRTGVSEGLTPYITNQVGDLLYSDKKIGQVPMMVPGANIAAKKIQDEIDETEKNKARKKAKEDAYKMYIYME